MKVLSLRADGSWMLVDEWQGKAAEEVLGLEANSMPESGISYPVGREQPSKAAKLVASSKPRPDAIVQSAFGPTKPQIADANGYGG